MLQEIEALEQQVKRLKDAYHAEEIAKYKNAIHKNFKEGDIVKCGDKIGIVGWTENKYMNLTHNDGYMGIDLLTGTRGFAAGEKRDDWELVTDPFYTTTHTLNVELTGVEIMILRYHLGGININPNVPKTKLYAEIDRLQALETNKTEYHGKENTP